MRKYLFGFIGTGNMGGALAMAAAKCAIPTQMVLTDACMQKAQDLAQQLGCDIADQKTVCLQSKYIFLGVKPQVVHQLLQELAPIFRQREEPVVLVSMVAGVSIAQIQSDVGGNYPVIRILPNTPVSVGSGLIAYAVSAEVTQEQEAEFCSAMNAAGWLNRLEERLADIALVTGGCTPAFAYMFIEALADGAVACGLPRDKAMQYAAQAVAGAAQMVLQSGRHPGQLKDAVCSPGGTTIAGVGALEASGFRGAAMQAVTAAYEKTLQLDKK